jgi:hypothetical protein
MKLLRLFWLLMNIDLEPLIVQWLDEKVEGLKRFNNGKK